ncbi:bromodomain adjacent to zinc finger domain protein 1A-like [Mytilus californianus]|uniref:bromodomain adjacent to zinc finger domain protein 1A-like n=1 Tax=Mytilus californianus TaxID=6549 RepID=UPI002247E626|nr:bromodomain adjacent to zinc finger domain protein 1A-like [Mytilus californianus]
MPLLRKQPFHRQPVPTALQPDDDVFHCKLTNEIFKDYEEFFERIILCNSLVWSCSITGKASLTFQEALESEEKALKHIASFPAALQKPLLFLAQRTKRSRLADMNDDVFMFAKDRYFIGEIVDVVVGGEKKSCKVLRVVPPVKEQEEGCIVIDSDDEESTSAKNKNVTVPKSEEYRYVVQETGKSNITITVPSKQVSRRKGLYTRDKSKLFLKNNSDIEDGLWKIKVSVLKKRGVDTMQFVDFYAGVMPVFEVTESKKKSSKKKKSIDTTETTTSSKKKKDKKDKEKSEEKEKEKPKPQPAEEDLTPEEKAAFKEQQKQEKLLQKEELRRKWEEEKLRRKEEKAKEVEKRREEKRIQAEQLKEWSRHRDDMECDDLKVLPEPTPIKTKIPQELFGDCVLVLEFVNIFKSLFDLRAYFPRGFTFDVLEEALLETDHNGILTDVLLMMMTAIFSLQEQEEAEEEELSKQDEAVTGVLDNNETDVQDTDQLMELATVCSLTPMLTHGLLLKKLPLDSFTLSEIVRLHLLSSGAKVSDKNVKYRFQERGGYTSLDDPGLEFRRRETALLKNLSLQSIFDLPPADRLKIITVLIQQFMTYAASRDTIEDGSERLRLLRYDLKQMQWAEQRREREEAGAKYKKKMEEKARERDKREEWRQNCLKEQEQRNKRKEAGEDVSKLPPIDWQYKSDEVEPTPEEKEEVRHQEEEEEANKKAEFALKEKKVLDDLSKLQQNCSIVPVGRDRMYRRYWIFNSIQGLFVEDDEKHVDTKQLQPSDVKFLTGNTEKPKDENGSDKENDSINTPNKSNNNTSINGPKSISNEQNAVTKNGDVVCISDEENSRNANSVVKMEVDIGNEEKSHPILPENEVIRQIVSRQKNQWAFISTEEEFEHLLNSLNCRGYRESALRAALLENRSRIEDSIDKCPVDAIFKDTDDTESVNEDNNDSTKKSKSTIKKTSKGLIKSDSAQEVLEINLRELLLDLEERIYVGALGTLKIKDRLAWRDALEKGSFDPQSDDPLYAKFEVKKNEENGECDDASSVSSGDTTESIVKDLSKALLQIQHGIESKYLVTPLGEVDEKQKKSIAELKKEKLEREKEEQMKKKEEEDSDAEEEKVPQKTTLERWQDSLLHCTSLSQIFLYLGTLEKSIAWSKSALNARCRVCRRKGNADQMLLCDLCDRGHHIYCLKPPLKIVPTGDWFCPDCRPKEIKRSPLKGRRKTFVEESENEEKSSSEEEDDSSDEEEVEGEEEDSEEEQESDEEDVECAVCNKGGTLICCDACPLFYHLGCANPQLKKVPRGKWLCQICLGTGTSGKIKLPKHTKGKLKCTPKSTPSNSRKGSPRESPITVPKGSRKRPLAELEDNGPKLKKGGRSASKLPHVNGDMDLGAAKSIASSSRGTPKVHLLRNCEEIVHDLVKHEDCWPFLKPVSKKLVPDYHLIISRPMDFATIRNKINNYGYSNLIDLVTDVRQVFSNCFEYNKKTSVEFKAGLSLSKLFEKRLKDLNIDVPESSAPPSKRSRRTL